MRPTLTDANVLYPSVLRNLLMHFAVVGLCDLRWSDDIHEEWIRNLVSKSAQNEAALRRTRSLMERALPEARVSDHEALIPGLTLPDPDDRHVLAAAIRSGAAEILTFNLRDFPPALTEPHGVRAVHPDPWLCRLCDDHPEVVHTATRRMLGSLKNPPMSPSGLADALRRLSLPQAAERLPALLSPTEDSHESQ